jgi:hypothetical protein
VRKGLGFEIGRDLTRTCQANATRGSWQNWLALNAAIVDILCVSENTTGLSGIGVQIGSTATVLRNDTAVGHWGLFNSSATLAATNLIIHGTGPDDIWDSSGVLTLVDCEYSTVMGPATPSSTGQVSGAPVFADAATGDYHTLSNSPGNGQGVDSAANGTLDLDGNAREVNGSTDLGAYELPATPTVTTGAASQVTQTTATIAGTVRSGRPVRRL